MPKDGRSPGKQMYRCGDCTCRYTPDGNRHFCHPKVIEQALAMYAEGSSVAAIGRAMEIKEGSVLRWVKKSPFVWLGNGRGAFGSQARLVGASHVGEEDAGINSDKPRVNTISFDEMWTRVGARRWKKRR